MRSIHGPLSRMCSESDKKTRYLYRFQRVPGDQEEEERRTIVTLPQRLIYFSCCISGEVLHSLTRKTLQIIYEIGGIELYVVTICCLHDELASLLVSCQAAIVQVSDQHE